MIHKKTLVKIVLPTVCTPFLPTNQPAGVPKPTTTRRFLGDGEFGGTPRGHWTGRSYETCIPTGDRRSGGRIFSTKMLRLRAPMEICKGVFFVCTSSGVWKMGLKGACDACFFFCCCFYMFLWNSFCLKGVLCVAISTLEVDIMFVVCKLQIFIELYFCYVSLTRQSG